MRCSVEDEVVVLCPDTGRNYLSKMFDDSWMAQNGFLDLTPERTTAGDLLTALNRDGQLIYLLPDDSLQRAAETFREHGISQLPVVENGQMIGAVQEITIVHAQHRGVASNTVRLRDVMARPLPEVETAVLLEEVYRLLLSGSAAVAVTREGHLSGLITRSDLMEFYERTSNKESERADNGI
jgi:cystathionine beta-synthase